ncbi:alpha/beta fold hydrolase [Profundibacter amoris]|uniref:Alpha/beta fold hydrolase n=1 Tax=Profundibacter amoris TaxID=2171755 RepID=A0A347UIQ0_9RHOB|nr:alpha/beta fold hydrolase [Profundibacter amoris]AXX98728.1 alpha/beta fold hydrolase [Profundibacter amoris]
MINTVLTGTPTDKPPLLIVHGLYGSARNWGAIARRLSDDRQVISVDMRNHGESDWFDSHSYPDMAEDLAEVIKANGGQADVIGHSMGGKAAMMLALTHPALVRRLLVADIAPVVYDRTQVPYIHAMRGLDLTQVEKRSDADRLLAKDIPEDGVRAFLLQSLDIKGKRWRLNLDGLEREMPLIMGFPDVDGTFDGPTLFLSGGESDYVQPEHRARIKALFPKARFARIAGVGHWLHAEKPREFTETARTFFDA